MICMKKPYSFWQPTIGILDLDHCLEPCQAMFSWLVWSHIEQKTRTESFYKVWGRMIDSKNVELWLTINLKRGTLFSKSVLFSGDANSSNLRSLLGNIQNRLHVYPSLSYKAIWLTLLHTQILIQHIDIFRRSEWPTFDNRTLNSRVQTQ